MDGDIKDMEYINEIEIHEAIIHILDSNVDEPILNEYTLEMDDDIKNFLLKHVEKCFKDDELKYGKFNLERNIVKELVQEYLVGIDRNLLNISKELAKQLFVIMKCNEEIPAGDLLILSLSTEQGPMVGILKLDYVKNFTHEVQFVDDKIEIGIVPQSAGLPAGRIQKAAFIKQIKEDNTYDLLILDKQKASKDAEYSSNYFVGMFLGATTIINERDMTKTFIKAAETWTRNNITDDADKAEEIRSTVKSKLKEDDTISIEKLSDELFTEQPEIKENFTNYIKKQGLQDEVAVDKTWVEKKLKRVRLNIDKQIDLYINEEIYHDSSKFEIQRNGDGSINLVVKNVINYIEK